MRGAIYLDPAEPKKDKPQKFATQQDELQFWKNREQNSEGDLKKLCQKMVGDIKGEMARRELIAQGLVTLQTS